MRTTSTAPTTSTSVLTKVTKLFTNTTKVRKKTRDNVRALGFEQLESRQLMAGINDLTIPEQAALVAEQIEYGTLTTASAIANLTQTPQLDAWITTLTPGVNDTEAEALNTFFASNEGQAMVADVVEVASQAPVINAFAQVYKRFGTLTSTAAVNAIANHAGLQGWLQEQRNLQKTIVEDVTEFYSLQELQSKGWFNTYGHQVTLQNDHIVYPNTSTTPVMLTRDFEAQRDWTITFDLEATTNGKLQSYLALGYVNSSNEGFSVNIMRSTATGVVNTTLTKGLSSSVQQVPIAMGSNVTVSIKKTSTELCLTLTNTQTNQQFTRSIAIADFTPGGNRLSWALPYKGTGSLGKTNQFKITTTIVPQDLALLNTYLGTAEGKRTQALALNTAKVQPYKAAQLAFDDIVQIHGSLTSTAALAAMNAHAILQSFANTIRTSVPSTVNEGYFAVETLLQSSSGTQLLSNIQTAALEKQQLLEQVNISTDERVAFTIHVGKHASQTAQGVIDSLLNDATMSSFVTRLVQTVYPTITPSSIQFTVKAKEVLKQWVHSPEVQRVQDAFVLWHSTLKEAEADLDVFTSTNGVQRTLDEVTGILYAATNWERIEALQFDGVTNAKVLLGTGKALERWLQALGDLPESTPQLQANRDELITRFTTCIQNNMTLLEQLKPLFQEGNTALKTTRLQAVASNEYTTTLPNISGTVRIKGWSGRNVTSSATAQANALSARGIVTLDFAATQGWVHTVTLQGVPSNVTVTAFTGEAPLDASLVTLTNGVLTIHAPDQAITGVVLNTGSQTISLQSLAVQSNVKAATPDIGPLSFANNAALAKAIPFVRTGLPNNPYGSAWWISKHWYDYGVQIEGKPVNSGYKSLTSVNPNAYTLIRPTSANGGSALTQLYHLDTNWWSVMPSDRYELLPDGAIIVYPGTDAYYLAAKVQGGQMVRASQTMHAASRAELLANYSEQVLKQPLQFGSVFLYNSSPMAENYRITNGLYEWTQNNTPVYSTGRYIWGWTMLHNNTNKPLTFTLQAWGGSSTTGSTTPTAPMTLTLQPWEFKKVEAKVYSPSSSGRPSLQFEIKSEDFGVLRSMLKSAREGRDMGEGNRYNAGRRMERAQRLAQNAFEIRFANNTLRADDYLRSWYHESMAFSSDGVVIPPVDPALTTELTTALDEEIAKLLDGLGDEEMIDDLVEELLKAKANASTTILEVQDYKLEATVVSNIGVLVTQTATGTASRSLIPKYRFGVQDTALIDLRNTNIQDTVFAETNANPWGWYLPSVAVPTYENFSVNIDTSAGKVAAGLLQRLWISKNTTVQRTFLAQKAADVFGIPAAQFLQTPTSSVAAFSSGMAFLLAQHGFDHIVARNGQFEGLPNGVTVTTDKTQYVGGTIRISFDNYTDIGNVTGVTFRLKNVNGTVLNKVQTTRVGNHLYEISTSTFAQDNPLTYTVELVMNAGGTVRTAITAPFTVEKQQYADLSTNPDVSKREIENVILTQVMNNFVVVNPAGYKWDLGSGYHDDHNVHAVDLNGTGGADTDRGNIVKSVSKGVVKLDEWGNDGNGLNKQLKNGAVIIKHSTAGISWTSEYLHMPIFDTGEMRTVEIEVNNQITTAQRKIYRVSKQQTVGGQIENAGEFIEVWNDKPVEAGVQIGYIGGRTLQGSTYHEGLGNAHMHFVVKDALGNSIDLRKVISAVGINKIYAFDGGLDQNWSTDDGRLLMVEWNNEVNAFVNYEHMLILDRTAQMNSSPDSQTPLYWLSWNVDSSQRERVVFVANKWRKLSDINSGWIWDKISRQFTLN